MEVGGLRANPVIGHWELSPGVEELIGVYEGLVEVPYPVYPLDDVVEVRTCQWKGCDPGASVIRVLKLSGEWTHCGKEEGRYWVAPEGVRLRALRKGPCGGCEVFEFCKGGCPYEAEELFGRSRYCEVWKWLWGHREEIRRERLERLRAYYAQADGRGGALG